MSLLFLNFTKNKRIERKEVQNSKNVGERERERQIDGWTNGQTDREKQRETERALPKMLNR